ncbi:preprotein translocase subunit SecY [Paenibacillus validus]|uniref:Protein translocase subunit SecY n=1 Tax=Paenibacillus validus TaxID=44253 RepID=A0A7X3CUG2_9BACL|nr:MULTISPECIES: preprotein translocase subunit SecY [Paenibacillus]MED4600341.1 preprotein translocase subunit SecY [Paenibacillus validus]MED4606002.1 preprotein translocase subunit SecY [Paenibacillus validus]MUG73492.1 preprotein translocase subunit SecY [Paenibacillus validus]
MFRTISNIMKVDDLRKRILFTLLVLIVYRIGAFIPVPNINTEILKLQDQASTSGVFALLNTFSGGALFQFSIFAMTITPYITASIIVQLLSMDVIPTFTQWAKEGEVGRKKLSQITRYGTIVLGLIQAFSFAIGFNRLYTGLVINPNFTTYALIAIVLTAGTAFLMWLGEQITENGIGNGISIIIFAGIVAAIPTGIGQIYQTQFADAGDALFLNILKVLIILIVVIALIAGVIFVQQGVRKIPVQYAKRVVGRKMFGGQSTHIPLKVNAAGVIPVIFALSLLVFPPTIASFWRGNGVAEWIITNLSHTAPLGMVLYVLLIIGFTYFYTFVQFNPVQMAEQMKKNGGYIPGIRPGKNTEVYFTRVMTRITLSGALFLAAVSIIPMIFAAIAGLPQSVQIGGTSLLIVVGVGLETMKTIESQLIKRHYKGFINK